jgi:hypothetical protein
MKELFDVKISAQRNLERAGRTFSVTAWEYQKAIRNGYDNSIASALKAKRAEHLAALDDARVHHDATMELWYKFRPADRDKIGIVLMPSDVYVK